VVVLENKSMANAAKNVMLAESWNEDIDPTGWWISEKLDGVRAYW
jgi:DNA ligase-1